MQRWVVDCFAWKVWEWCSASYLPNVAAAVVAVAAAAVVVAAAAVVVAVAGDGTKYRRLLCRHRQWKQPPPAHSGETMGVAGAGVADVVDVVGWSDVGEWCRE